MLSRRFHSRPESSASPVAGGAGTAEPELPSPPPPLLLGRSACPLLPPSVTSSRHSPAGENAGPAGSSGAGAGPGLSFSRSKATPTPTTAPPPRPGGGGAQLPSPGCSPPSRRLGSLPCSRLLSPGSILSRRSGEGAAGGGRSPSLPEPARRTAGTPRGSGRARESPGCVAGPRRSTLRPLGGEPRGEPSAPTGRGGARRGGEGWSRPSTPGARAPQQRRQRAGPSVRRSVRPGCSPRESGDSEEALPNHPPPSRTRWLLPRFLASRLNPFLTTRRRERLSSPLHTGPLPFLGDPEDSTLPPSRSHASREIPS